jgi:HTH domain
MIASSLLMSVQRSRRASRAARLLTIQMMLETRGRMSVRELAAALEISVRTLHGDISGRAGSAADLGLREAMQSARLKLLVFLPASWRDDASGSGRKSAVRR